MRETELGLGLGLGLRLRVKGPNLGARKNERIN